MDAGFLYPTDSFATFSSETFRQQNPWFQPELAALTGYQPGLVEPNQTKNGQPSFSSNKILQDGASAVSKTFENIDNLPQSNVETIPLLSKPAFDNQYRAFQREKLSAVTDVSRNVLTLQRAYYISVGNHQAAQYVQQLRDSGDYYKTVKHLNHNDGPFNYAKSYLKSIGDQSNDILRFDDVQSYLKGIVRRKILSGVFNNNRTGMASFQTTLENFLKNNSQTLVAYQKQFPGLYEHAADMYVCIAPDQGNASDLVAETAHRMRAQLTYGDAFANVDKRVNNILSIKNKAQRISAFQTWSAEVKRSLIATNDPDLKQWVSVHYDYTANETQKWIEAAALRGSVLLVRATSWLQGLIDISENARRNGQADGAIYRYVARYTAQITEGLRLGSAVFTLFTSLGVLSSLFLDIANGNISNPKGFGRIVGDLFYVAGLSRLNQNGWNAAVQTGTAVRVRNAWTAFAVLFQREATPVVQAALPGNVGANVGAVAAVVNTATERALPDIGEADGLQGPEVAANRQALNVESAATAGLGESYTADFAVFSTATMSGLFAAGDVAVGLGTLIYGVEEFKKNHVMRGIANMSTGFASIVAGAVGFAVMFSGGLAAAPILGGIFVGATAVSFGLGIWAALT